MVKVLLVGKFKGWYALVDDCDAWVLGFSWAGLRDRTGNIYVQVSSGRRSLSSTRLHRLILGLKSGDSNVDHIDGNGLNCQRSNLRLATPSQNAINSQKRKGLSSSYKGVTWHKQEKKWMVRIMKDARRIQIGYFLSEIDAAKAYDKKAKELFGEYARLNFLIVSGGVTA